MRNLTAFILLFVLSGVMLTYSCKTTSGSASTSPKPSVVDTLAALSVNYNSPWLGITIENKKISKVKTINHFNPDNYSAVPDSTSTETIMDQVALNDTTITELMSLLEEQNFWDLEELYGAPEGYRYYPYVISAQMPGKSKQVTFRNNPSYDLAPQAFTAIEEFLKKVE